MTAFKANLDRELARRAARGEFPVSVVEFERRLRAIGYRRDRSMECRSIARIVSGDGADDSYPSCGTTPVEIDTGLRFCNADADRGPRFEAFREMRDMFAVSRGYILEF